MGLYRVYVVISFWNLDYLTYLGTQSHESTEHKDCSCLSFFLFFFSFWTENENRRKRGVGFSFNVGRYCSSSTVTCFFPTVIIYFIHQRPPQHIHTLGKVGVFNLTLG